MSASPSESLIALLAQLRLATAGQARSVAPQVSRLAHDLPGFDSVWVDALAQARVLTPFQAAQINGGSGLALAIGPYVLSSQLAGPSYAKSFAAFERINRAAVRLLVVDGPQGDLEPIAAALERLVERSRLAQHPAIKAIRQAGVERQRVWAACRPDRGVIAARWLVENGHYPAAVVHGVARQMAAALVELEQIELVHGDISPWGVTIDGEGRVGLLCPGLRPIVRRDEGYAFGDLQPEAYDTLAPERIESGSPAGVATDIYACGCLWWHLATGRPPFAGGSTIAKLKAVHRAKAPDVERLTSDAPPKLVAAIRACMAVDPADRPPSFAALAEMLGSPTRVEAIAQRRMLSEDLGPRRLWGPPPQRPTIAGRVARAAAIVAYMALLVAAPIAWRHRHQLAWWPQRELVADAKSHAAGSAETPSAPPLFETRAAVVAANIKSATKRIHDRSAPIAAPQVDRVIPTAFHEPKAIEPRLLRVDGPQRLACLRLRSGQTVRGKGAGRPLIAVSSAGLQVYGEDITFENIDFVFEDRSDVGYYDDTLLESDAIAVDWDAAKLRGQAIVWIESQRAEFCGCSFQDGRSQSERQLTDWRPSAIAWSGPPASSTRLSPLPGAMTLDHCVFWHVDAAVECRAARSVEINARQSLHACGGPMVRLFQTPRRSQTVMLNLTNVTLRAASAVLECPLIDETATDGDAEANADNAAAANARNHGRAAANFGRIAIQAVDSVFAPDSSGALAIVDSASEPGRLLEHVEWTGQGSLVTPATPIAAWRSELDGELHELAEEDLQVAGLVRGELEFEGAESAGPDAAHVRRWQAPLRSSEPPGIGAGELSLPRFARLPLLTR